MLLHLIAVERVIAAPPATIFDLLADPTQHPVIDGGGTVRAAGAANPPRLSLGAKFGMDMRIGAPYQITNTVVEFAEDQRIAWRHFNGHIWRYVLTPVEGGTLVREEWDPTRAKHMVVVKLLGFERRNRKAMAATLAKLADLATGRVRDQRP